MKAVAVRQYMERKPAWIRGSIEIRQGAWQTAHRKRTCKVGRENLCNICRCSCCYISTDWKGRVCHLPLSSHLERARRSDPWLPARELLTNEGTARTTVVTQSHAVMLSSTLTPHSLPSAWGWSRWLIHSYPTQCAQITILCYSVANEDDIQKLLTTAPEQLTDQELLLSTISAADLSRKHSDGWDKEHPKFLFWDKAYRFWTFTVRCHMTSQITDSGKHKRGKHRPNSNSQCTTQTSYVRARAGKSRYRDRQRHHRSGCKQADQPDCHGQIGQKALSWELGGGVEWSSDWKRFDVWFLQWHPRPQGYTGDCAVCWFHHHVLQQAWERYCFAQKDHLDRHDSARDRWSSTAGDHAGLGPTLQGNRVLIHGRRMPKYYQQTNLQYTNGIWCIHKRSPCLWHIGARQKHAFHCKFHAVSVSGVLNHFAIKGFCTLRNN